MADEVVTVLEKHHVPSVRAATKERPERKPCKRCKLPIVAGQAYVIDGPYHVRCGG